MTTNPQASQPELLPDLIDLDALLLDVSPLATPHDWAAPEIVPDDEEFSELLASIRVERDKGMA